MKKTHVLSLLIFSGSILLHVSVEAQNIRGDTIYVNANSKVAVVFPSAPSRAEYSKDGSYEVGDFGKTSLSVKASKRNVKEQTMKVTEGKRKHLFVLAYKEEVPTLRIDWSNLRKLKAHVEQQKKATAEMLTNANKLFDQQLWDRAQPRYQQLVYTVEEKDTGFVHGRLRKIQEQLQAIADKKYKDAIDLGVAYGKGAKFAEAKQAFTEALLYKPNDALAIKNISFIEQEWFKDCLKKGDDAYNTKNYVAAKAWYLQAKYMQPNDVALQGKITQTRKKADPIILKMMIKQGDSAFQANELVIARKAYDSALVVKQGDAYCKAQLTKIDKLEKFNNIINKANSLAATANTVQQYDLAINEYRYALVIFPNRDFPKDRIKELTRKRDELTKQLSMNKNKQ